MAYRQLLELARRFLIANIKDLDFPIKLSYVLTYRCNAKCRMCNIWRKEEKNELSLQDIDRFFAKSNRFSWIDISGGEIFLRDDVFEVIETVLRRCRNLFLLHFATNGLLPGKIVPCVERILKLKPPKLLVTVSLDGYRELNDTIRGVPGGFNRAMATFRELRKFNSASFKVFLGMTLIEQNLLFVERSFDAFSETVNGLKFEELHVNIAQKSTHYFGNAQIPIPNAESLRQVLQRIRAKRKRSFLSPVAYLEDQYLKCANIYLDSGICPKECQALSASCFVDIGGDVYPCSIYNKAIANIRDYDYDLGRLFNSDKAKKLRLEIRKGECPQCWTPCEAYQTIIANFLGFKKGNYE